MNAVVTPLSKWVPCPYCGWSLVILRRPYETATQGRFWDWDRCLECPSCRRTLIIQTDQPDQGG